MNILVAALVLFTPVVLDLIVRYACVFVASKKGRAKKWMDIWLLAHVCLVTGTGVAIFVAISILRGSWLLMPMGAVTGLVGFNFAMSNIQKRKDEFFDAVAHRQAM